MASGGPPESPRRFELTIPATRSGFARGFDELRRGLDTLSLDPRVRFSAELIFEEVVANVLRHGTRPGAETRVSLEVTLEQGSLRLTFLDDGAAFDPRGRPDPAPPTDLEHAETGGRGLMLIRSFSSAVEYQRTPEGQNRLSVLVRAGQRAGPG
jgi:anti-sigma regulatory factor (Ser/Thr protein kinase)